MATVFLRRMFYGNGDMTLKVFLSATLRECHPDYEPSAGIDLDLEEAIPVAVLLRKLKIPQEMVKIVMVNGLSAPFDYVLRGDERVAFFPPVGGG